MGLINNAKHLMLNALATAAQFASLHTGDPSTTGANEVTGGTPAYARKSITWSAASSGAIDSSNTPEFDVPACTVAYVGFWSASASGTFYGSDAVTNEVFAAQGTYTVTDADIDLNA